MEEKNFILNLRQSLFREPAKLKGYSIIILFATNRVNNQTE